MRAISLMVALLLLATSARAAEPAGEQGAAAAHHGGKAKKRTTDEGAARDAGKVFDGSAGAEPPTVVPGPGLVIPPEQRTPEIAELEIKRNDTRLSRMNLEDELAALQRLKRTEEIKMKIFRVSERISLLENQENAYTFQITEALRRPAPAAPRAPVRDPALERIAALAGAWIENDESRMVLSTTGTDLTLTYEEPAAYLQDYGYAPGQVRVAAAVSGSQLNGVMTYRDSDPRWVRCKGAVTTFPLTGYLSPDGETITVTFSYEDIHWDDCSYKSSGSSTVTYRKTR